MNLFAITYEINLMALKKSELYYFLWQSCDELCGSIVSALTVMEQRRDKTRVFKQGMMREILTGRTRLL